MDAAWYLDEAKKILNLPSDYALAKRLGVGTSTISNYRTGTRTIDEKMALKIESETNIPAVQIITDMQVVKAKKPEVRNLWRDVALLVQAVVIACVFVLPFTLELHAGQDLALPHNAAELSGAGMYIMLNRRRKKKVGSKVNFHLPKTNFFALLQRSIHPFVKFRTPCVAL